MKKKILTLIQVVVTLFILGWLFRDPATNRKMLEALGAADPLWILASFAAFGIMRFLSVIRWQILLRVQGIHIGLKRLSGLTLIGLFFNIFMPGGTGGDVVKTLYLLREAPGKKAQALLSVMVDRIVGLIVMFLVAGVALAARYDWLMKTPATSGLVLSLVVIAGGSLAFLAGSFAITGFGLAQSLPARLPLRGKLIDMSEAYNLYARAWQPTLFTLVLSLPIHLFSFTQFYCVAKAFPGIAGLFTFTDFLALMPIVATITAVPISVGGTGVREGLFVKLLGDLCGIAAATAIVVSLTGYLVQVIWGVIGGIVYLFYRSGTPPLAQAVQNDIAEAVNAAGAAEADSAEKITR